MSERINCCCVQTLENKNIVGYASMLSYKLKGKKTVTGEQAFDIKVPKGKTVKFTKMFSVHFAEDRKQMKELKKQACDGLKRKFRIGPDVLLKKHVKAWKKKWNQIDIKIRV